MVNNSTNINKMNNSHSPQLIEQKKRTQDVVNPGSGLGQTKKVAHQSDWSSVILS
jgi:glucokinase